MSRLRIPFLFFFFNDPASTDIYTLSLHDALPICPHRKAAPSRSRSRTRRRCRTAPRPARSEEHTSELQSHVNIVCRHLLEKKKTLVQEQGKPTKKTNTRHQTNRHTEN